MPIFVWNRPSGSREVDENVKSLRPQWCRHWQRQTTDKSSSEKLHWAFGSGELKWITTISCVYPIIKSRHIVEFCCTGTNIINIFHKQIFLERITCAWIPASDTLKHGLNNLKITKRFAIIIDAYFERFPVCKITIHCFEVCVYLGKEIYNDRKLYKDY